MKEAFEAMRSCFETPDGVGKSEVGELIGEIEGRCAEVIGHGQSVIGRLGQEGSEGMHKRRRVGDIEEREVRYCDITSLVDQRILEEEKMRSREEGSREDVTLKKRKRRSGDSLGGLDRETDNLHLNGSGDGERGVVVTNKVKRLKQRHSGVVAGVDAGLGVGNGVNGVQENGTGEPPSQSADFKGKKRNRPGKEPAGPVVSSKKLNKKRRVNGKG